MSGISLFLVLIICCVWILKGRLFQVPGTRAWLFLFIFFLKILAGCALYWIYSRHYTDRGNSDIYRYFDDATIMFSALKESPSDFFRMLTGINADDPSLMQYYERMNNWNLGKAYNFYNDNRSITRFNALVMLFSFGNYHVHTVVMCFLSLCGATALYRAFHAFTGPNGWIFSGIFFIPSVLFWGSGVLKEGLVIFFLGLLLWNIVRLMTRPLHGGAIAGMVIGLLGLFAVKVYVLICLIAPLLAFIWAGRHGRGVWWKYPVVILVLLVPGSLMLQRYAGSSPIAIIAEKQNDFWLLARGGDYIIDLEAKDTLYVPLKGKENILFYRHANGDLYVPEPVEAHHWKQKREAGKVMLQPDQRFQQLLHLTYTGSRLENERLNPTASSIVEASPIALVNVLLRPFPWEYSGFFSLFAILENLLLLSFLVYVVSRKRPLAETQPGVNNLFFLALTFTLGLALLIGWITPVMGAIVRYKVPLLPFLFIALALWLRYGKAVIRNKM